MKAPAAPLALCFVAGLASPVHLPLSASTPLVPLFLAAALLSLHWAPRGIATGLVLLGFATLGNVSARVDARVSALDAAGHVSSEGPARITGLLRAEPEPGLDVTRVTLDVDEVLTAGRRRHVRTGARVSIGGELRERIAGLAAGDRLRMWATLRRPTAFRNPGGFDAVRYLGEQRIHWVGTSKSALLVTRLETGGSLRTELSRLRTWCRERISRSVAESSGSAATEGMAVALLTGDRSGLSPDLLRSFQRAGVFHIMAISGAHVGIWSLVLFGSLRWGGFSSKSAGVILLVFLPLYALFCGGRAPVARAAFMASVFVLGRLLSLRSQPSNSLALAAILWLTAQPTSIRDAGFQLSFAAIAALVSLYQPIFDAVGGLGLARGPLSVSLAAQLGAMPVSAWHFHRVTLWAPLLSLLAIPLAGAVCVLAAAAVIATGVPYVSVAVGFALTGAVAALTTLAEFGAGLPAASVRVAAPSLALLVGWTVALAFLASSRSRCRRAGLGLLVGISLLAVSPLGRPSGELEMTVLDVGHGDAIALFLPDGGAVVVDGGGLARSNVDTGDRVVIPFLLDAGHRTLDAVVVSHEDFDHVGGLASIVEDLAVGELWVGRPDPGRPAYRRLRAAAKIRGVAVRRLRSSERFELGGAELLVLSAGDEPAASANDRSVVLAVRYAGRTVLLTGDAEEALERALTRSNAELRADVLKVAHHGSRSSTTQPFLDVVRPSLALLSTRRSGPWPIPSPEVLARLRESGAAIYRTDRHGAITVRIRGDGSVSVATFTEPAPRVVLPALLSPN